MILIADSSAVITSATVDKLDILQTIFKEVYIPNAIYQEITKTNKKESIKPLLKILEDSENFLDKDTKNLILKYAKED
jgi:predicted nucleic acid-binding protein